MRPLAGGPLRRARSGRRLAGAKLKYTDMNSKYALPKDGGLIVDSAPVSYTHLTLPTIA